MTFKITLSFTKTFLCAWVLKIKRVLDEYIWIIYIYTKACSLFNLLGMLKHVLDRTASIKIYLAFIWPILEYGSILRDNCSQENSNLLENVQIEAERIITRLWKIPLGMLCIQSWGGNHYVREWIDINFIILQDCLWCSPCIFTRCNLTFQTTATWL